MILLQVSSVVNHSTACKEKWLEISLLCDGWTSRGGGLSTLNRELTVHLAGAGMVRVTVFLPEGACAHEHKKETEKHGINVVEAKRLLGYDDPQVWLSFPPPDLKPDVVIGHGQKLGRQGQIFKCLPHRCKWIQMVHTDPKELSKYKIDSQAVCKGEEKHKTEVGLCKMAHLVVTVGPKLYDAFSKYLGNEYVSNILKLTPGLFEEFKDLNHALREGSNFKVLLCGRSDPEDFKLKGFDIAAKAFACIELREPSYLLIFVGALKGKKQEMKGKLLEFGIREDQLFVKEFVESREEMKKLLCEVDLVIMPSWAEGFGLVALEALSAGLPVLVGKNSGLAQAIRDLPNGKLCIVDSEEPQEWATAITTVQQGHNEYLQKIKDLREAYGKKYSWEEQCEVLVDKMREMILHAN